MAITETLTVTFIVLKILKLINWSWFFVLLPEIIAIIFYMMIITFNIIIFIWKIRNWENKQGE